MKKFIISMLIGGWIITSFAQTNTNRCTDKSCTVKYCDCPECITPSSTNSPVIIDNYYYTPAPIIEIIPVQPYPYYYWVPGYWHWNNHWVWIRGCWTPRYDATWLYYQHRNHLREHNKQSPWTIPQPPVVVPPVVPPRNEIRKPIVVQPPIQKPVLPPVVQPRPSEQRGGKQNR
jgi:hypothetical protein